MTSALPLHCAECLRPIGKHAWHALLGPEPYTSDRLLCLRCKVPRGGTKRLHAKYYPDCPEEWHDLYDHPGLITTSRRGAVITMDLSVHREQTK